MNVRERAGIPMLDVDEALRIVLETAPVAGTEEIALEEAAGRYLAEPVHASADMPPFDRTAMDGFAVRSADVAAAPVILDIVEEIPAGKDPARTVGKGQAARIMTGAMIPPGADAVVMVEQTEDVEGGSRVRILKASAPGRHIRRAGEDLKAGALLLPSGTRVDAAAAGLLASEGKVRVEVGRAPGVAVLSTGDELVRPTETPRGSQIRETNSWSLRSLLGEMGLRPVLPGIARDRRDETAAMIAEGLRHDVLLISGGVSMGEFDLVGECLSEAGCRALFQRVAIQPGKPLFFGTVERPGAPDTLVFGLPGNPVSTIVDFLVFARPALRKMMGSRDPVDPAPSARLEAPVKRRPGRRGYLPARLRLDPDGRLLAEPVPSMGSADMVALSRADAFLIAPEDRAEIPAGESVRVLPLRR